MSAERFYLSQGMTKTSMQTGTGANKPKRRLKADYVKEINTLLETSIKSLTNMTVADLKTLEKRLLEKPDE